MANVRGKAYALTAFTRMHPAKTYGLRLVFFLIRLSMLPLPFPGSVETRTVNGRVTTTVRPPHVCRGLDQFAVTRGGAYFFLPGLTALRLIAAGRIESA